MQNPEMQSLKELFPCTTDACRRNVDALLKDSISQIGVEQTLQFEDQWKILSQKLNNTSKLTNLGDRNHRLMLLEFIKAEAADQYKSSYFNRAKIRIQYIQHLQKIGPYVFAEVITIVNKLKLIKKYHSVQETFTEDHVAMKIREILQTCESKKRTENSNIAKFINIVSFEDREGLVKELGKMLRNAWAKQKQIGAHETQENVEENERPQETARSEEMEEVKPRSEGNCSNLDAFQIDQYLQDDRSMCPEYWT